MIDTEKNEFKDLILGLAETFGRSLSKAGLVAYWLGLKDLELSQVKRSFGRALHQSKFMPSVAEMRRLCGEDDGQQRSVKAWISVCEAARNVGSYRSVNFEDAAINCVIRSMGGWPEMLSRKDFDTWTRKEFMKAYESVESSINGDSEECLPLPGLQTKEELPVDIEATYEMPKRLRSLPAKSRLALRVQEEHSRASSNRPRAIGAVLRVREMPKDDAVQPD